MNLGEFSDCVWCVFVGALCAVSVFFFYLIFICYFVFFTLIAAIFIHIFNGFGCVYTIFVWLLPLFLLITFRKSYDDSIEKKNNRRQTTTNNIFKTNTRRSLDLNKKSFFFLILNILIFFFVSLGFWYAGPLFSESNNIIDSVTNTYICVANKQFFK